MTKIIDLKTDFDTTVEESLRVLRDGGTLLYPTDTLYGLGVDAVNPGAVKKVYTLKGREKEKGVLVMVSDLEIAGQYVELNETARKLADKFLPGPLSIVLKRANHAPPSFFPEYPTIGFRIPDNQFCLELTKQFGKPITTTSANPSGEETETSIRSILNSFGDKADEIELAIDAGKLTRKKPSTVVHVIDGEVEVLREGVIAEEAIVQIIS